MNSVTAPSRAPASRANFAISSVRSTKPRPEVSIVSSEVTMVVGLTADGGVRENDLDAIMNCLSVVPAKAETTLLIMGDGLPISLFHVAVRNSRVHEFFPVRFVPQTRIELQCMRLGIQEEAVDVS